jgi:putative colanic acid biosynthesis UDP-glucose lipid carrier transferase
VIILKNAAVQILFVVLFVFYAKELLFTRNFTIFFGLFLILSVSVKHFLFQKILRNVRRHNKNARRAIIIGTGEVADKFKRMLTDNPEFGYRFVGFVSAEDRDEHEEVIGEIDELQNVIVEQSITDAIIALPLEKFMLLDKAIKTCDNNAVNTFIIPDYFKFLSKRYRISLFGDFPIISVRTTPLEEAQSRFIKRVFDLTFGGIGFVLFFWWLIPLIAIIIKLTSKGPAFFIQDRIGQNEKIIKVFKFRTMTVKASGESKVMKPATDDDDRITSIGKILRRTNLDELPQFINVLLGSMSLVGPRPHPISFNDTYKEMVEEIKLRNRIKPGVTGWAQIHGLRGDSPDYETNKLRTRKRVEYDIWYIENWSLWLDIQIIIETILQTLGGKNGGV